MSEFIFETTRLGFRAFVPEDLDQLALINADELTSRYVGDGKPLDRATTELWINNSRSNVEKFGYGTGAVVLRESMELIGWAGFARPPDEPEELIYGFGRDHWGRGYGTELLAALLRWSSQELQHASVRATVDHGNTASIAMLMRVGFKLTDACYDNDPDVGLYELVFAARANHD